MLPFNTTFSTKFELQRKINMPGSSRARSTRGQENEAWAVYKKNPSLESWDDLSGQTPRTRPNLPPQDSRDGFFLYTAQALFSWPYVDLARLLRRACSRSFWITSFEFVKVCGIRFSIWKSFIGFYICCYPISTIMACLFSVGVRISWKKLCWKGAKHRFSGPSVKSTYQTRKSQWFIENFNVFNFFFNYLNFFFLHRC